MIGGATVAAVGSAGKYVTPAMAEVGDQVLLTKGPAIEATALFAATFPSALREALGAQTTQEAEGLFYQMSVVKDCRIATAIGVRNRGVTALHDATECGLFGGLVEVAAASGVGMRIDKESIPIPDAVSRVCGHFGMNPYHAISEGTLIISCKPYRAQALLAAFAGVSITAAIIGEITEAERGTILVESGAEKELAHPGVDPFWSAYRQATAELRKG
jgi:hydrogenase maturation factor